jgi:hypothetical protein
MKELPKLCAWWLDFKREVRKVETKTNQININNKKRQRKLYRNSYGFPMYK